MADDEQTDQVVAQSRALTDLLSSLEDDLKKASSKNDNLLEAIESLEAKEGGEVPLVRNLRARLAATHAPCSALRRDLAKFSSVFGRRLGELERTRKANEELNRQLVRDQRDLQARITAYQEEKESFDKEQQDWKKKLERAQEEIVEQNDRLTVLSQQLTGVRVSLDERTSELASQRIAFEEEKLARRSGAVVAVDSEAEELREKLKEQVLRGVELDNALLKTELVLHQRDQAAQAMEARCSRLQREVAQGRLASSKAIKQFEKRTLEANRKLSEMTAELTKAQEHAHRFQEMLVVERRKQQGLKHALEQELQKGAQRGGGGEVLHPSAQKAFIDALSEQLSAPSKTRSPMRMDDIIRKNETLLVESAGLKAEICKLRVDNTKLIRRVRASDSDAHLMRNQVVTSMSDRLQLMKRLDKSETQYRELEQSLTKQATDWVSHKRQEKEREKRIHWSQIEPIPVLGASERTWNLAPAQRPHGRSRSIPVQKW